MAGVIDLPKGFEIAPILQYGSARPYDLTNSSNTLNTGGGTAIAVVVPKSDPKNYFAFAGNNTSAQNCFYGLGTTASCTIVPYDPVRGDPFFQLDTRLAKGFKFGERANVQVIGRGLQPDQPRQLRQQLRSQHWLVRNVRSSRGIHLPQLGHHSSVDLGRARIPLHLLGLVRASHSKRGRRSRLPLFCFCGCFHLGQGLAPPYRNKHGYKLTSGSARNPLRLIAGWACSFSVLLWLFRKHAGLRRDFRLQKYFNTLDSWQYFGYWVCVCVIECSGACEWR